MDQQDELHSFPFDATVNGSEYHYRITQSEHDFGIERDGVIVATLENREGNFKQLTGVPLDKELLENLCDHIKTHYR